jgi:hypothetical protein
MALWTVLQGIDHTMGRLPQRCLMMIEGEQLQSTQNEPECGVPH